MTEKVTLPREGLFESECSTQFKKCKYKFKWTINEFSFYRDASQNNIQSSIFSDGTDNGLKWHLEVNPTETYLYVYLILDSNNVSPFLTKCKFCILNANLNEVKERKRTHQFGNSSSLQISDSISMENLFNNGDEFLPDDRLTILCEIIAAISNENISRELTVPECHVPNNLGLALLKHPELSDITLCAGGREIKAHRTILAVQSKVFKAMFQHDMKENRTNRVDIQDVDYDILVKMLHFIYTDQFPNLLKVTDLIYLTEVAEKYELEPLKLRCEKALGMNLSDQNAVDCYIIANQVKAENLKRLTRSFILANAADVAKTSAFALLVHDQPDLVVEVLSSITNE